MQNELPLAAPTSRDAWDITPELGTRASREPDHAAEGQALVRLAHSLAEGENSILQNLSDTALALCNADGAGISLLEAGNEESPFVWHATSGVFHKFLGGTMPRDLSPCGVVIEQNAVQLMAYPIRRFPNIAKLDFEIAEILLVPFRRGNTPIGTLWVVVTSPDRRFDAEDARLLSSLSHFAAAATLSRLNALAAEAGKRELQDARARLDAALEAGAIATWTYDLATDRIVADSNLARLFAVTPEEAAGGKLDAYLRAIHPGDRERVTASIGEVARHGGTYDEQYRIVRPDGSIVWVEAKGRASTDEAGRVVSLPGVIIDITERRRSDADRAQAEDFQRLIFESVKDFSIFTCDLEGRITTWNKGAENVFGYAEAEAIGQPAALVFTPEDRAAGIPEKEMQAAAETGKGTDERWHLRKGGGRFFASGMVRPIRDDAGALIGFTKVARDITASKIAQETIRQNEERYRNLFNSIDEGFCVIELVYDEAGDPVDYRYLEVNPAFERHTGLHDPAGRRIRDMAPDHEDRWVQAYAEVARTGEDYRTEGEAATIDRRLYQVHAFRVGEPAEYKVAVLFSDITERKRAENAVAARAGQLQRLAEISTRINEAHDVQSVLGLVTEEARILIGADHAATIMVLDPRHPQPINVFSHSEERRAAVCEPQIDGLAVYQLIQKANQSMRLTAAQLDAEPAWRMLGKLILSDATLDGWMAAPLVDHTGRVMGLMQVADKRGGEFTADDEAILVQLSRIASIAIENARLYEELSSNDQRKDEFLAMLAHELRNPLGAISSGVDLVERTQKPELLAQLRDMIKDQVKHLTHLIDDLLDVSRITQGKIELRKTTVELHEVVRQATELAQQQITERHHKLNVKLPDEAVYFVADPTRVEQILNNLLTNAAKYSDEARSISLRADVEGSQVVFRVLDEGFGIAPEMLPRVFGLFTQVDATIDRARGGLGIGLTLVKSLVEMHGGTVEALSEGKGKGAEFIVRLPIGEPRREEAGTNEPKAVPTSGSGQVLIVDDNQHTARLTARLLASAGFTCETSHDGITGLEKARAMRPEILLLDIGLPGLNGYEIAQAVRDEPWGRGTTLIAISGYGEEKARDRSWTSGFDHHLTKPLDFDQLMRIIGDQPRQEGSS